MSGKDIALEINDFFNTVDGWTLIIAVILLIWIINAIRGK